MSTIPLDYETLRLIWWLLLGVLLIGFAIMGGRDLGVGALLPFVARTDEERRVLLNLIGPTWEGNQVWLVLGGGAIFAAFPPLYAVSFSGFYLAMIVILLALILRPVGFKFRGKIGLDVALEALRDCTKQRKSTPDELWAAAKVCRVTNVMRPYLEALA